MGNIPDYLIGLVVFIFGLLFGSFMNVIIYRVPRRESVVFPGSRCTNCNTAIKPYDNIPVLSYLILRGRCRNCGAKISIRYPLVELLVGAVYFLVFLKVAGNYGLLGGGASEPPAEFWLSLVADLAFVSFIIPLIFIDFEHKLLPNAITYPGIIVMLALRLVAPDNWILANTPTFGMIPPPVWPISLIGSVLGMLAGGGVLWLVAEAYFRLRRIEGMGLGDVKMMLMVGAFLGWQLTLLTIFIGSLLGSIIGIMLIAFGRANMKTEIPFGVYLGLAAIISLFIGPSLIDWYASNLR
jgi:leader peptidase (prepilin peptidase)/N-methyltransferase